MKIQHFNGIDAIFATDDKFGLTAFTIVPSRLIEKVIEEKVLSSSDTYGHLRPEPMIQIALSGDSPTRDFSSGVSLRNTSTALDLRFIEQNREETENQIKVVTVFKGEKSGITVYHTLCQNKGYSALECSVKVVNTSDKPITLEYLASFTVDCLSPFVLENDADELYIHRINNYWAGEGRLQSAPASFYAMEDSQTRFGYRMERFGQNGTMPARGYLPFVAIEDKANGVTWACNMQAPESWLIEVGHHNSALHMSGGIADFTSGHWRKRLDIGQSFCARPAYITVAEGDLLAACNNLTEYRKPLISRSASDNDMPIIYNEFLYTHGEPTFEKEIKQLPFLKDLGVKYFVIDDGWYCDLQKKRNFLGDWETDKQRFPSGLKGFSDECKKFGIKSGIWYEFENVTEGAPICENKNLFLTFDGNIIKHENRMFLDFRKKETIDFLKEKVIDLMKKEDIGYVKIDYNENIGLGVDGTESYCQGLREHMECVIDFYREIRKELPDLIIETCSSGGMRHEPLFLTLGDMVSFSDFCENPMGAVCACDLHRVLLPSQMQVWAYLDKSFSAERVYYALAEGLLGRLCLSGDIAELSSEAKSIVKAGCEFYEKIKFIIKDGKTIHIDTSEITSFRKEKGAFSLARLSNDEKYALVYAFAVDKNACCEIALPNNYEIIDVYGTAKATTKNEKVIISHCGEKYSSAVVLLKLDKEI